MSIRFEKIWIEQCRATKGIKTHFGWKSALDYLIREKLLNFAAAADQRPEFARAMPHFNEITDNVLVRSRSPIRGLVQVFTFQRAKKRVEYIVVGAGGIPRTLR